MQRYQPPNQNTYMLTYTYMDFSRRIKEINWIRYTAVYAFKYMKKAEETEKNEPYWLVSVLFIFAGSGPEAAAREEKTSMVLISPQE